MRGDLLGFEQTAHAAEVHLQNGRATCVQQARKVVLGAETLAGRDRNARRARNFGHLLGRIRRHGLLEPQRIIGLHAAREADGTGRRHLAMRAEQQIRPGSDRLAQLPQNARTLERAQGQLTAIESRIRTCRVELERREALRQIFGGTLGRQIGVLIDIGAIARPRIDVRVRAQPLVDLTTEQLVDRLVCGLADDVPASHLERAQHGTERQVGVLRVARGVHAPPHGLDVVRIASDEVPLKGILEHPSDQIRSERHTVGLTDTVHVIVGSELHEHEVSSAKVWGRIADDEGFDAFEFHASIIASPCGSTTTSSSARDPRVAFWRIV